MNELAEVLARQAAQAHPMPNLDDVQQRVARRRRRVRVARISVTSAMLCGSLAVLIAVTTVRRAHDGTTAVGAAKPPGEIPAESIGGMMIPDAAPISSYPQTTLERADPHAGSGSYAVVVRRVDGQLGTATAVVSYPAPPNTALDGTGPTDPTTATRLSTVVLPRTGGSIVVRSTSLDAEEITVLGDATQIIDGRPVVTLSDSMAEKYQVVAVGTERPPVIHETRYGCDALGEAAALGALCYTGVATSPGFEDALYSVGFQRGPPVHGHSSVVSTVGGGNATLAWEPRPGVIAYVGYSGSPLANEQVAALARLAERATTISPDEWLATRPQPVEQDNSW